MNQNLDKKIELKNKLISLLRENKFKITIFCGLIILLAAILVFFKIHNENKNSLISQKYIQAGLYLSSNEIEDAKKIYEEIILSKNKFYSILALNTIIEKNLESNEEKILKYFNIIDSIKISDQQRDILRFKKILFLIKISKIDEAKKLISKISPESELKRIVDQIPLK